MMGPPSSPSPPSQPPPDPARELRVKKERRRNLGRSARKRRKKQVELAQLERTLLQRQQKKHEQEHLKNGEAHVDSVVAVETNRNKKEGESSTQSGSRRRGTNALSSLRPVDRQITWPCILELRRTRTTTRQGNNDDHPWWKSPDDETALVSQLGYVPGNAIAIVTRLRNLEQHADPRVQRLFFSTTRTTTTTRNNNNNNDDDNNTQEEKPRMFVLDKHNLESPVVLQLFPLALRDEGGGQNSGDGGGHHAKRRTRRKRRRTDHWSPPSPSHQPPPPPPPLQTIQQQLQSLGTEPAVEGNDSLAGAPHNPDAVATSGSNNHSTNNNNNKNNNHNTNNNDKNNNTLTFTNASTLPINQENNNNNHNDHSNRTIVVEPFPTMYWLTHPMLKLKVSQLEVQGLGLELEERLRQDEPSLQRMFRAHEAYQQERMKLYQQALVFYMTEDENDNARRQGNRDENKETQEAPPPPSQIHSTSTTMKNDIGKEAGEERPMTAKRERRSDEEDDDDREDKSKALVEENHERSANNDHHHHHHHDNMNFHVVVDLDDQEIRQWESIVLDTQRSGGIAGIRNFASIKCLHAHCAHYLSGGPGSQDNVVGQWVVEALVAGGGETATSTATTTTKSARRDKGNCF